MAAKRKTAGKQSKKTATPAEPAESAATVSQHIAQPDKHWLWRPGQSGNPKGRGKGSRNKLGEAFLTDLQADWEEHGVDVIKKVRDERPHEYLKVVASILPKELNVRVDPLEEMDDDELTAILAAARAALRLHQEGGILAGVEGGAQPH